MVADSVGYIRLSQFIDGTSNEIRRALVDLKQRGARRLVLDLRNNPGGCSRRLSRPSTCSYPEAARW